MSDLMSKRARRDALRGAEGQLIDLIFEVLSPEQWAEWLTGFVTSPPFRGGREALRGVEVPILDVIVEAFTSEQWAEWLRKLLECAADKGDRGLAQRMVRAGAEMGDALHEAVGGGHGDVVSDLLQSGASIDAKDRDGSAPLHIASDQGETEMVQLLLLKGADKNAFDANNWTPLYIAAFLGHVAAALALLGAGADVSLRCGGQTYATAMHVAAQRGHVEIVRAVIENGVDLGAVTADQSTALHSAALTNSAAAVEVLAEAGANIEAQNGEGCTPLHTASLGLGREALLSLVKHGANVNARNKSLATPLIVAAKSAKIHRGAAGVVDALLRADADETLVDEDGSKAVDVIEQSDVASHLAEEAERVRLLLANAPADRAWRRRGYLVLCRAHPSRLQQTQLISGNLRADTVARRTRSCARVENSGGIMVAEVLGLEVEGIFRTIVGYL